MRPIEFVISRHECLWFRLLECNLEWSKVNLPQRPRRDDRVLAHPFMLLIIPHEMLDRRTNTTFLQTSNISGRNQA